ncbi:hypothetical protein [Actinoplanes sp. NBRC 101535]|uniref:hypothetical protein n=1 Tax=Actinoplanes sp. NBRC 101535 TaxID=3032196 RepID=UPI0025553332|nr:hypothetical protein [Actinoplanes sp. NBRC 101535]
MVFYPVRLVLPRRAGVTLWGGNVDGEFDYFLTGDDSRVVLADSVKELAVQAPAAGTGLLAALPGYPEAVRSLTDGEPDVDEIDFAHVADVLARGLAVARMVSGDIVSCLDAARDLAIQVRDDTTLDRLQGDGAPLRDLYHHLFGEQDDIDETAAAAAFGDVTRWFESHVG